jgi:glycosyltransferase involved in cell wall biosynthesis
MGDDGSGRAGGMTTCTITGTIAVATRNRATVLAQCLASLENQIAEPGQLEVLVVDNGSTDGTPALLDQWRHKPDRRVVVEPDVGLSNARNTALATSTRDVVLLLDDDALVASGWARAHLDVYADDATVAAVGGPVGLHWPNGRPGWITDELANWYSALELGDEVGPFPTEHGPYGTNMSVRRSAAMAVGGFDPRLGRVGTRLISGEEADLTRRLRAAGWGIVYTPAAAVVQQVLPERLHRGWVRRRAWSQGISNARLEVLADRPRRRTCLRRSSAELRDAGERWRRRRRGADGEDELTALCLVLAHAAAGFEYARIATLRGSTV